jgi:hypothetical protein
MPYAYMFLPLIFGFDIIEKSKFLELAEKTNLFHKSSSITLALTDSH